MKKINFNVFTPEGQKFITPLIIATSAKAKKEVNVNLVGGNDYALNLGYVMKAIADGNASVFEDKTKTEAGASLLSALGGFPDDTIFTVSMPTEYASRNEVSNPEKWTALASFNKDVMVKACQVLATSHKVLSEASAQIQNTLKGVGTLAGTDLNTAPVYGTPSVKGKRSSNKGEFKSLI